MTEDYVKTIRVVPIKHGIQSERFWHTSFQAWLYRIAHNLVVDYYRRHPSAVDAEMDEGIPSTTATRTPRPTLRPLQVTPEPEPTSQGGRATHQPSTTPQHQQETPKPRPTLQGPQMTPGPRHTPQGQQPTSASQDTPKGSPATSGPRSATRTP